MIPNKTTIPLKFILRNLMPNIDNIVKDPSDINFLLENNFCLTNLSQKTLRSYLNVLKDEDTGIYRGYAVKNVDTYVENNTIYLKTDSFYSSAKLEFSIERKVKYDQIFDISKYLGLLQSPLVSYALQVGGTQITNMVRAFGGGIVNKMSEGKKSTRKRFGFITTSEDVFSQLNPGQQQLATLVSDTTQLAATVLGSVVDISSMLLNTFKSLAGQTADRLSYSDQIFYSYADNQTRHRTNVAESVKAFSLATVYSAKIFKEITEPFPNIKLTIINIAYKSVDEHIPLLKFVQQLVTPLTLALPMYPVQLIFFNKQKEPKTSGYKKGLPPFTYYQSNVGYFNVTGITIKDLGLGYGTSDSLFYKQSGLPIPIGIEITLTLQAYDPYYFNFFDPTGVYAPKKVIELEKVKESPFKEEMFYGGGM